MALPNARQREFPKDYSYIFVAVDMQANSYFGISRVLNATEALNYLNSKPYEGMEGGSSDVRLRIYQFSPTVGNPADLVLQQLGRENLSEAPSGPIHCPAMGGGKPNNCK